MNLTDFFKRMFGYTNKRFLLFCFLIFISILYLFFYPLRLSPDSTNYIATAEYLTAGNGFYYNTNWPSLDMSLSLERYTEYPPLFPVIIAVWGAVVGYTGFSIKCFYLLNILLLNYSVFLLLRSFNVNLFFLLLAFCLINFNGSSNVVYEYFWSEVIFLALAIFSIHVIMKRKTFGFVLAIPFLTKTMGVLLFFHELIFKNKIKLRFKIFLSGAFGLILGSLWFLYNYLQVGNTTRSHFSGNVLGKFDADFLLNKIGIPFHWLVTGWINNPFPENGVLTSLSLPYYHYI
ncbi:hypothetical protein [Leptospira idonii]|uniref:DUF2029 domain-containing protein n=1 Tax=Leptospira idonii TaxID=1193500 RepID=A0A4R9M3H4_9LEPT|nr:hypothetical protein [Leptospira idonii]TGN20672.1 hypothetical protein EHS15_02090 [Leptospira idonii]